MTTSACAARASSTPPPNPTRSRYTAATPKPNTPTSPQTARTATVWANERLFWATTSSNSRHTGERNRVYGAMCSSTVSHSWIDLFTLAEPIGSIGNNALRLRLFFLKPDGHQIGAARDKRLFQTKGVLCRGIRRLLEWEAQYCNFSEQISGCYRQPK